MAAVAGPRAERRGGTPQALPDRPPRTPIPAHLHPQNAKNDEEGTTDDHNVADGLERGHQRLYHQLQPLGPADDPGEQRRDGGCSNTPG